MNYRRALLLVDPATPADASRSLLRSILPQLDSLLIVVPSSTSSSWWARGSESDASREALEQRRAALADAAASVSVQSLPTLGYEAIAALCEAEDIELIVLGSRELLGAVVRRRRPRVPVLWAGDAEPQPLRKLAVLVRDVPSLAALAALLRDRADASLHATLLAPSRLAFDVETQLRPVSGIAASIELATPSEAITLDEWLGEWASMAGIDLVVAAAPPSPALLERHAAAILLVPAAPTTRALALRTLDVPDVAVLGPRLRVRVEVGGPVGGPSPAVAQELGIIAAGRVIARVRTDAIGELELADEPDLRSIGIASSGEPLELEPLAAIEQLVAVLRPDQPPLRGTALVLFDAELSDAALDRLLALPLGESLRHVALRARPTRTARAIRERLRIRFATRGLEQTPCVLDVRTLLDEGEALDVVDAFDAVRLARAARRLQRAGFEVHALAHRGSIEPVLSGCVVVSDTALVQGELSLQPAAATTSTSESTGNRVEVELHNPTARTWLLDAIAAARRSLHLQVYIVSDDPVTAEVERALVEAGARGVAVRVLVDSLHAFHGSFGTRNPLLERLADALGVELRVVHPITELPSLGDLKQRDHRKLVVCDGELALLGGRNLAAEYYTGFEEVVIGPSSSWRELPWLDAGARIAGPAVAALERGFLAAWREAGGEPFELVDPVACGDARVRVVEHRGLREADTHDTYLELIASARQSIDLVLGFPLALELQRALSAALARGVLVRVLVGRPAPSHDGVLFPGPWTAARAAANELVHSRLDPLIDAGAIAHLLVPHAHERTGWAPELGLVHPHVHAKLMIVDARRFTIGSANPDITSAYWESELLLVVEHEELARELAARVGARMADSHRIEPGDASWQALARRRAWMRHWPSLFSA